MSTLLEQASLIMIPSGYKEDVVYSVIPENGNGDLAFTRASNGTRVNSAGLVEVCPWNMLPNSEVFALWNTVLIGGSTITVTDNFVTAPNGTLTGAKVVFSTFSDFAQLFQFYSLAPTQNLTATLYAKVPSGTRVCNFGFYDGAFKNQQKTLTTEWQRIEYTGSIDAGSIRACWFYGDGGASNVEVHLWGGQLNIGSTAKPYFPTTDRLNVPRLTYQNGGGGCPSLLLEKQSTNLVTYSEQFDNAGWTQYQGGTITANSVTSPDGTQNADTLSVASGQTYSGIYQSVSASSDVYTVSIFAKYNTKRWLFFFDASAIAQGWFDIQNGVLGTIPSGHTGTIENFGNGWYRCTFKKNTAVTPAYFQIGLVDSDGFSSPTSNGSSYIYGAQLEASSYPTSYIPTTSSSATRVADFATTNNISSLFGSTEGSFFIEMTYDNSNASGAIPLFLRSSANAAYNYATYLQFLTPSINLEIYNGGASQGVISGGSFTNGQTLKVAFGYKANDFVLYVNGVQIGTDTSGSISASLAFIDLGTYNQIANTYRYNGKISEAVLFPTRLTNAELASLTTI